ncbi:hypothetical protein [Micromonospora deserti]|uniref:Uncharacterized protein n=1 Tax=Micromonospora deserti TaxID=2070366 RepID=A0A2W2C6D0_9ACTN|nr:hypothetical protein [Micromonospora deserti]PZF94961.1 hypothetical protein C1I99_18705 [Micromonospora deserti]
MNGEWAHPGPAGAGEPRVRADQTPTGAEGPPAGDRLAGGLLGVVALVAVAAGGWWWQANAPATGPVAGAPSAAPQTGDGFVPGSSARGASFRVDPRTGAAFRVDPRDRVRIDPGTGGEAAGGRRGGLDSFADTIWRERATLTAQDGVFRQAGGGYGARYLLQYRCWGPGELLVVIVGGRSAAPLTSGCDGSVTSTEVTGVGRPVEVGLSTAGAEPVRVEAQLVALP